MPDGSATAKAIDYSLKRWQALTRFIDDGDLPADCCRIAGGPQQLTDPPAIARRVRCALTYVGAICPGYRVAGQIDERLADASGQRIPPHTSCDVGFL